MVRSDDPANNKVSFGCYVGGERRESVVTDSVDTLEAALPLAVAKMKQEFKM